ncbi:hypothetical protein CEXT_490501 [Caerostris extrusa]|uniref:Transmembrane protein n=1 Tax=Caerostris extrusa TaxID=172846 RepID=A0AAV4XUW9_CAEEX|nr:hypothetical protein CEXT_490501 [Caerostris extrusa]
MACVPKRTKRRKKETTVFSYHQKKEQILFQIETFSKMKRSSSRRSSVRVRVGFYRSLFSAVVFCSWLCLKAIVLGGVKLVITFRTIYRSLQRASTQYENTGTLVLKVCALKRTEQRKKKKRQYFLLSNQKKRASPFFQIETFSKMKRSSSRRSSDRGRVAFYWSAISCWCFLVFVSKATVLGELNPERKYRTIGIKGVRPQKNKTKKKEKTVFSPLSSKEKNESLSPDRNIL